jgi:dihydroorotate dehydrogenase
VFVIINRLGFNSDGADKVARRVGRDIKKRIRACLIVSLGPNKKVVDDHPETSDYIQRVVAHLLVAAEKFLVVLRPGDGIEINISSPNTPGLRKIFLQLDDFLILFTQGIKEICDQLQRPVPAMIIKIPPDDLEPKAIPPDAPVEECPGYQSITPEQLTMIIRIVARYGFCAITGVNTTSDPAARIVGETRHADGTSKPIRIPDDYQGGVSADPLYPIAIQTLQKTVDALGEENLPQEEIAVIAGGGIRSPHQALAMYNLTARNQERYVKGVFAYSGLVKEGPILIHRIFETITQDITRRTGVLIKTPM